MICPKYNALVLEIFRTNVFLATNSETYWSSLLSVAVISVAVVADMYSVETHMDTLALLKAMIHGIDSTWIMLERIPLKNALCVLLDR